MGALIAALSGKDIFVSIVLVLLLVFAVIVGGIAIRGRLSKAGHQVAKDGAESDYFGSAVGEITLDRNNWRSTAEDAWRRNRRLDRKVNLLMARVQFLNAQLAIVRRMTKMYPELGTFLPSDAMPLEMDENGDDSRPPQRLTDQSQPPEETI